MTRFKDLERYREIIKKLGINRSAIYFKSNFKSKLIQKYLKVKKAPIRLNFLKSYFKSTKEVKKVKLV